MFYSTAGAENNRFFFSDKNELAVRAFCMFSTAITSLEGRPFMLMIKKVK